MSSKGMKMYLLVNTSLKKMQKGKMAAQVGHAVQMITERMVASERDKWRRYKRDGMRKIVVKSNEEQMKQLFIKYSSGNMGKVWCIEVRDAGHTQIDPDSLTVVGFCPMEYTEVPDEIMNLKLM